MRRLKMRMRMLGLRLVPTLAQTTKLVHRVDLALALALDLGLALALALVVGLTPNLRRYRCQRQLP